MWFQVRPEAHRRRTWFDPVRRTRSAWIPVTTLKTSSNSTSRPAPQPLGRHHGRRQTWTEDLTIVTYCECACVCVGKATQRSLQRGQTPTMKPWRYWRTRWPTHLALYVKSTTCTCARLTRRWNNFSLTCQSQKKNQSFHHKEAAGPKVSKAASYSVHAAPPPGQCR